MKFDPLLRELLHNTRRPYYILAPGYTHVSAGIRACHHLAHALNTLGEEAYLATPAVSTRLRALPLGPAIMNLHVQQKRRPIAVYPEVVLDNPLNCETVCRWLLNRPGKVLGQNSVEYPDSDLIFHYAYSRWAVPSEWTRPTYQLFVPCVDPDEMPYPAPGQVRDLECIYGFRYLQEGLQYAPRHQKRIEMGSLMELSDRIRSRAEISAILQRTKVIYVYEPSAIASDASLSGCPVVFVKTPFVGIYNPVLELESKGRWTGGTVIDIDDNDPTPEELARITQGFDYREYWEKYLTPMTLESISNFIEITQKA